MKVLELFAGTRSISKSFEERKHETFSVEWNKKFENISLYADIGSLSSRDIIELCHGVPDVIWISFDCTTYSIAGISHHRKQENNNLIPVSEYAKFCDYVNKHVLDLLSELKPKLYFIENPVGGLRKMDFMRGLYRYTITYCQYELDKVVSERRMKPTDIWTNHPNPKFKAPCKNGSPCHQSAPRGSRTGTQGMKNSVERSTIPKQLCEHIVDICEEYFNASN